MSTTIRGESRMIEFAREQIISVKRLAEKPEVSPETIRRWFRQGLEKKKIGKKVYTSLEALDRFTGVTPSGSAERLVRSAEALKRHGIYVGNGTDASPKSKRRAGP